MSTIAGFDAIALSIERLLGLHHQSIQLQVLEGAYHYSFSTAVEYAVKDAVHSVHLLIPEED